MVMAAKTPQNLNDVAQRLAQFYKGLTLQQRLGLAAGIVLVAGTLWLFVALMGQPKYVTLYSGLRPEEAQNLATRLAAKNIAYQISPEGNLQVPEDKLDLSRLETAAAGLPRSARMGFELFDTPNWAGSDFSERVNYQRALEGELERTLGTLSEVEAVRVHLVLPQESLFTEQQHEAKAAVIVRTRAGRLSEQAEQAIPQLVASAVDRLRPENVTVVDADSNTPLLHGRDGPRSHGPYGLDEELSRTLVQTLTPVVGADHVRASVHVEYELGTSEDTQETYDPKTTATLTQEHSEESSTGPAAAGVPGTASNVPSGKASPPASAAAGEQSNSRSDSTTYAVSKTLRHEVEPPGRIHRIAAAVLVDDAMEGSEQAGKRTTTRRKRTAEEMKTIEELARAAIGVDAQRGDVLAVENLSFQAAPAEELPPPGKVERLRRLVEPWSWMMRYAGLAALFLVVYLLVLGPVKRQALAAFRQLPGKVSAALAPVEGGTLEIPGTVLPHAAQTGGQGGSNDQRAIQLKRVLTDKVKNEPVSASKLIESWVRQGQP